jgi:hypothetical protein
MGTKSEDAIKAGFAEGAVLESEEAAKLEEEYVHKVYDVIAPHFSHTRHSPWPKVGISHSSERDCASTALHMRRKPCEVVSTRESTPTYKKSVEIPVILQCSIF